MLEGRARSGATDGADRANAPSAFVPPSLSRRMASWRAARASSSRTKLRVPTRRLRLTTMSPCPSGQKAARCDQGLSGSAYTASPVDQGAMPSRARGSAGPPRGSMVGAEGSVRRPEGFAVRQGGSVERPEGSPAAALGAPPTRPCGSALRPERSRAGQGGWSLGPGGCFSAFFALVERLRTPRLEKSTRDRLGFLTESGWRGHANASRHVVPAPFRAGVHKQG